VERHRPIVHADSIPKPRQSYRPGLPCRHATYWRKCIHTDTIRKESKGYTTRELPICQNRGAGRECARMKFLEFKDAGAFGFLTTAFIVLAGTSVGRAAQS